MKRNKLLLLFASLGCLVLLAWAAVDENMLREWRRIQAAGRSSSGPLDVRLRQVVVPALRVTDRCVSCHVGMAPGEQGVAGSRVLAAHPPVAHDPGTFGCTTCHAGQGRATEKDDAHGTAHFWPEPMIPLRYAQAGCGSCHTHLAVPRLDALRAGRAAFERNDCHACHKLDGRGGTLRPDGGGMEGPDLSRVGARARLPEWYEDHLARRATATPVAWQAAFGEIPAEDRAAIDALLASSVGAPGLVEGKALFHSLGCRGCHKVGGVGGDDGPDLSRVGQRDPGRLDFTHVPDGFRRRDEPGAGPMGATSRTELLRPQAPEGRSLAAWFKEHFRAPQTLVPGSQMPALGLSEDEIDKLTFYLLSLRRGEVPGAFWPQDRIRAERFGEREFEQDGATLYGVFCASCHGIAGQGMRYPGMTAFPAVANPDFLSLASDEFLAQTVRKGRPGRRMAAWEGASGLRPEELTAVVAHLRAMGGGIAAQPDPKPRLWARDRERQGARVFASACASCHGADGQGGEGPALRNSVLLASASDTFLFETAKRGRRGTTMEGFGAPTATRPALADAEIEAVVAFLRTEEQP